ncbi:MAG: Trk family potassium uptake protein [Calditrichaeota bacterium]|nr:MAG: Trk family potassium uptake protein [Calditrichota bacterium]
MKLYKKLSPFQVLSLGYAMMVLAFAALLQLPVSSASGVRQPFIDALFIATSGISTSGLSMVDIGSYYSIVGQITLFIDFQIGGIGYMSIFAFIFYLMKQKMSLAGTMTAVESLAGTTLSDFKRFFKRVVLYTLIFETVGAVFLTIHWLHEFSFLKALYFGVFHSVSTFCTAGFALLPNSLMAYKADLSLNLVINVISLAGGISFFVLQDLYLMGEHIIHHRYPRKLSGHSKMAMIVTLMIIALGTTVILTTEEWHSAISPGERILISTFQAISASTTDGFNSVDIGAMNTTSLLMLIILMFIGASPGSTGGGMKTTTLGVMAVSLGSILRDKRHVNIFNIRIPDQVVKKSFAIFLFFILVLMIDLMILTKTETASLMQILFEIVSALGNTGLSMGITAGLSFYGKLFLILTMFVGRVGALTIGFAFLCSAKPEHYRYAEGEMFVG